MTLTELAQAWITRRQDAGCFLDVAQVTRCAVAVARYYLGFATLLSDDSLTIDMIDGGTEVDADEWAIMTPLFELYCERETAVMLEATRGLGAEMVGRSVSEVEADLAAARETLQREAFCEPVVTIGLT